MIPSQLLIPLNVLPRALEFYTSQIILPYKTRPRSSFLIGHVLDHPSLQDTSQIIIPYRTRPRSSFLTGHVLDHVDCALQHGSGCLHFNSNNLVPAKPCFLPHFLETYIMIFLLVLILVFPDFPLLLLSSRFPSLLQTFVNLLAST